MSDDLWQTAMHFGSGMGGAAVPAPGLDALRARLRRHGQALADLGVVVEDKQLSLALHYRMSRQREAAQSLIRDLLAPLADTLQVFGGKQVVNVAPGARPTRRRPCRRCWRGPAPNWRCLPATMSTTSRSSRPPPKAG
jgi:hypothetical protein